MPLHNAEVNVNMPLAGRLLWQGQIREARVLFSGLTPKG